MPLKKQVKDLKVAILFPCYRRKEYTQKSIKQLFEAQEYKNCTFFLFDDGSNDGTKEVLEQYQADNVHVISSQDNKGLRKTIIDFMQLTSDKFDILSKVDNDCLVPKNWLNDILNIFSNSKVDILSPNVFPSDAAYTHGKKDECDYGFMPTTNIGGLWTMKAELVRGMDFEEHHLQGIVGAFPVLRQIVNEKEPIMGWVPDVTFEDMGHWSGKHDQHIKTEEHEQYTREMGRPVVWAS